MTGQIKDQILYEDDAVLVCRKPAGIPVQTARAGQQDMVSLLRNYRAAKKEEPYIGLVHRLDQPVEGIMVFAKTKQAAAALAAQVGARSVDKNYYAVIWGKMKEKDGELCDHLLKDGRTNCSCGKRKYTGREAGGTFLPYGGGNGRKEPAFYHIKDRAASSDPCAAVTCRSSNLRGRQIRSKKRERVSAACALLLQTWACAPGDKEKDGV